MASAEISWHERDLRRRKSGGRLWGKILTPLDRLVIRRGIFEPSWRRLRRSAPAFIRSATAGPKLSAASRN